MTRVDPTTIAQAILAAPGWARVGITAPTEYLREEAAEELARSILADVVEGEGVAGGEQLQLTL